MRRGRAALAALTLVFLTLLVAGPARAGGPTSVLLVVPGAGQTASLYNSQADYEALAALVGAFGESAPTGKVDRSGATHEFGTGVTVTWLIHDVQVWRVDRVYVGGPGGPWISTQQSLDGSASIWDAPAAWHTATDGQVLMSLLRRLGVSPDSSNGGSGPVTGANGARGDVDTGSAPSPAAAASAESKQQASEPGFTSTRLGWGIAGLALGVGITVVALRLSSRASALAGRRDLGEPGKADGPDGSRADPGFDGEPTWPSTDELSWPAPRR